MVTNKNLQALLIKFPDMDLDIWWVRDRILKSWRDCRRQAIKQSFNLQEPEVYEHVSQYFPYIREEADNTMIKVIERLRDLEHRYSSQREMLIDLGLNTSTYHRWITGQTEPKIQNLVSISKKTGVSLDWLVGY